MSIIKFGVLVVGARGTFGGATFSANHSGPYVKSWARPADPRSALQTVQRSVLASVPDLWRALTPAQQAAWDTWAALPAQDLVNPLGETYHLTGFQWFTKINIRLLVVGRAARVPVPVQARPAAPTISDLEFPFDVGQTAFVEYPSAEFDPDFDLVLEAAQASSVGRQSPPSSFVQVATSQNPDDTAIGFAAEYNRRFGIGNTSLKGFVRLYRQTTDGLRSAPSAASFIATDGTNYAPGAKDYDGLTNWATHAGPLTGSSNGKTCTIVGWFRVDAGGGTFRAILSNTSQRFQLRLTSANRIIFEAVDTTAVTVVQIQSAATFAAGAAWHAFALSVDTAEPVVKLVVDGAIDEFTTNVLLLDGIMDFQQAVHQFASRVGASQPWDGCLSSFWLDLASALDVHDPAILSIFFSRDNGPQDLGDAGQLPTGVAPVIYFPDGDASNNVGLGENFVNAGVLNDCSTVP